MLQQSAPVTPVLAGQWHWPVPQQPPVLPPQHRAAAGGQDDALPAAQLRRTLAIFLRAELGFLGVAVLTAVHTPLFCGAETLIAFFCKELYPFCRAGAVDFFSDVCLPFLTNWLNVGILFTSCDIVCGCFFKLVFPRRNSLNFARLLIIASLSCTVKV